MIFFNLSSFYFFYFSGTATYVVFFPKVLNDVGYNALEIGVLLSIAPLIRFLTPFVFLKYFNINDQSFKLSSYLFIVTSALFYLTLEHFYALLLNFILLGISLSFILPFIEVIALKELGKNRYGKSRLFGSIGFIVVALILGEFFKDPYSAIHCFLFVNAITVLFAMLLLKNKVEKDEKSKQEQEQFSLLKNYLFWLSILLMQISFAPLYNFFTIYETSFGLSLQTISYLWIFGVICEILMLFYQSRFLKSNLLLVIKFCFITTIIRWLLLYFFPENLTMVFISQGLHAFSFALFHSSVIVYLFNLYENKKVAQQFMYGIAYGLGGFVGSLLAGVFYGEYLFLYASCVTFLAFIAISFQARKEKLKHCANKMPQTP